MAADNESVCDIVVVVAVCDSDGHARAVNQVQQQLVNDRTGFTNMLRHKTRNPCYCKQNGAMPQLI